MEYIAGSVDSFKHNRRVLIVSITLIVTSIIVAWFSLAHIKENIHDQLASSLQTTLETTKGTLDLWIGEKEDDVQLWANSDEVRYAVEELLTAPRSPEPLMNHPFQARLRSILSGFLASEKYEGMFIIAPDFISLASMRDDNIGVRNLLINQKEFIKRIFSGQSGISLPQPSDVALIDRDGVLRTGVPTMFVASPIRSDTGEVIAVMTLRINPFKDFSRIAQLGRIGKSGETYFFNNDGLLLSESRFDGQLRTIGLIPSNKYGMLSIRIRDPGGNMLEGFRLSPSSYNKQPLTLMVTSAIAGTSGQNTNGYNDYRGVPVIGAWTWDYKAGLGITTELDASEAYEPYEHMKGLIIMIMMVMFILFISLYVWTVRVSRISEMELERINKTLEKLSFQDALTCVANRRLFDQVLDREWSHALREKKPISLIMIDIDYFKQYNDHYGHQQGDSCLKKVAQMLSIESKRAVDMVARYGGEEFVLLLPETDEEQAFRLAEKCRSNVFELQLPHEKSTAGSVVTISLGVSTVIPDVDKQARSLIEVADKAMYQAKENGRNRTEAL
ncbi:MAG: diguanylate cyclase [Mariprofundaceae bacterium]